MADDTYRVFEHRSEPTIVTTSSVGATIAASTARGATLGLVNPYSPEQLHQAAARQYLDQTGRPHCVITSGYLLMQPQYEFTFECPRPDSPSLAVDGQAPDASADANS